jgi:hypothetical protein
MTVGPLPQVPRHRTPISISRVFQQNHRSPEPDCPDQASPKGIREIASLGPECLLDLRNERAQKGPEQCPGLVVLSNDR